MFNLLNKFEVSNFRLSAIMIKEFSQMIRDPATAGLMVITPLIQLFIFGYAINMTPTNLPTAVLDHDETPYSRDFITAANATGYFNILPKIFTDAEANDLLVKGDIQFIMNIPNDFSRKLIRNEHPEILIESDATDPVASNSAISALSYLADNVYNKLSLGASSLTQKKASAILNVHPHYNPISSTRWNIIPGLVGVILTMTLVMVTSMAIAKEYESGTQEFILATPATPIEIILGKMTPYLLVGYVQILIIISVGNLIMGVPLVGSLLLLLLASLPYIISNLSVGFLISTIARTQIQASVCAVFFFLPSLLLSGFFFPFRGMPMWAQFIGNLLPLSHYLVIVRGVMLKGATFLQILPAISAVSIFGIIALFIAIIRYRGTLD
ncbi:MAG: ABC transporter permease [Pseudomonadota bacterium]|nr:ABC transporter permease [Pseudomonadota bacterium]